MKKNKNYILKTFILLLVVGLFSFGLVNLVQADSSDSSLSVLVIDQGILNPVFVSGTFNYVASVPRSITSIHVTPTVNDSLSTITVNGTPVTSGSPISIDLAVGDNSIAIVVTAEDTTTSTYTIVMTRENLVAIFETYSGTGNNPNAIAFDGTNMWTANSDDSVTKISPTGVMTTYSGTGHQPYSIAFDGTNMWTANSENSVTKITPSGEIITYSGTGDHPNGIAFDGTNMWTANMNGNSVTKISPTGGMTTYPGTGNQPYSIAFDGTNMWTANYSGNSVTKISPTGGTTTYSIGAGVYPVNITFDGTNMWTANYSSHSVTKITPSGVFTTYYVGKTDIYPYGIVFDGTNMWAVDINGNRVIKITLDGEMTIYSGTGNNPDAIVFDGTNLWTANSSNSVTKFALVAPSTDSSLSDLSIDQGTLTPDFDSGTLNYTVNVTNDVLYINITPTTDDTGATIEVNGDSANGGDAYEVALDVGENTIHIVVTATDDITTSDYQIVVTREASNLLLLHEFTGGDNDGSYPNGNVTFSGSKLYGMTYYGGDSDVGTIFSIDTDGADFRVLHDFTGEEGDGSNPEGSLYLSDSMIYGMTYYGGDFFGTIFSIKTDGTEFRVLHDFTGEDGDGMSPQGSLTLSDSRLYGMTTAGGDSNLGTIFSIKTDGTEFRVLHMFTGLNDDGGASWGSLTLSGSTLYGMTSMGGDNDMGTIFSINTDGTGFKLLHEFAGGADDGSNPGESFYLSNSILYGMTYEGGDSDLGTIFSIDTDGTDFALLHSFIGGDDGGSYPYGSLTFFGSKFYGMTNQGGAFDSGTIFSINTDGTDFTLFHTFTGGTDDGGFPYGSLVRSGSTFYGMTPNDDGEDSLGTIFSFALSSSDSSDSSLSNLSINHGTVTPIFNSETLSYTANVANTITSLNVTPTTADDGATIKVNGATVTSENASSVDLDVGSNTINVVVTAEDEETTTTYTIIVTRASQSLSSDSSLSVLAISQGTLFPTFTTDTTSYTASVANAITSINISPTATDENSTITINSTTVTSGNASSVDLAVGDNTINIVVTAEDDSTSTYTIVVTRAAAHSARSSGMFLPNSKIILDTGGVLVCKVGDLFNAITGETCVNNSNFETKNKIHYDFGTINLKKGSKGPAVMELQRFLNAYFNLHLVLDGKFGPKVKAAVLKFQIANGLVADGIVGAKTKEKMNGV